MYFRASRIADNRSRFSSLNYTSDTKYIKASKSNSDSYFAYKIKTNYFMPKQVVWTFREFFFLQFDTKFASNQQRLAKIGTILWLLLSF